MIYLGNYRLAQMKRWLGKPPLNLEVSRHTSSQQALKCHLLPIEPNACALKFFAKSRAAL